MGKLPKTKSLIYEMYMAATKKDAIRLYDDFLVAYQYKYPKAVEYLNMATFTTVQLRTKKAKGCGYQKPILL